jgi:hypothetical protein
LGLSQWPDEEFNGWIVHPIAAYHTNIVPGNTLGPNLALLSRLRKHLIPIIDGSQLRKRDREPRINLLQYFVETNSGVDVDTFCLLTGQSRILLALLQDWTRTDTATKTQVAKKLDALAASRETELRVWIKNGPKVEDKVRNKCGLCAWLRFVWENFAAEHIKGEKVNRRNFVVAVLEAAGIDHPGASHADTLDRWIETEFPFRSDLQKLSLNAN